MNVTGTINSQPIDTFVRSLHRTQQLCNPLAVATLVLSTDFPNEIAPGQAVVLYEEGVKVFTGYVVKVTRERPSYDWVVEIHDVYTRCVNLFIDYQLTVGHDPVTDQPLSNYEPQSTDYWIGYLCNLAGVSYTSTNGHGTVPQGVQIGLRTVHESLQDIIAYSSQYVRANADGVLKFERVNRDRVDWTLNECVDVDDTLSDEWSRNLIKVYGYSAVDQRVFASASTDVAGLIPDRVTAVGAPMIQTQAEAQRIADYLLSELGTLTHTVSVKIEGNPNIHIGHAAHILHGTTDVQDAITTVIHDTSESAGYTTTVTIGERCPRIAGWSKTTPLIYAGTSQHGVYISSDGGSNWTAFNTGLPAGDKFVKRIGANSYDEAMAIVNGALYYTDGTSAWSSRTLPAPINMAADDPAPGHGGYVAVDALGSRGAFAVLTTNPGTSGSAVQNARSWVYECQSTGSTPGSWTSTQLFTSSTGSGYHVVGIDLKSSLGVPYVLGGPSRVYSEIPTGGEFYVRHASDQVAAAWNISHFPLPQSIGCNTLADDPIFYNWWAEFYRPATDQIYINFYSRVKFAYYQDGVYLVGSYTDGAQKAEVDPLIGAIWPIHLPWSIIPSSLPGGSPFLWGVTLPLYLGTGAVPNGFYQMWRGQVINFSLFWSPKPQFSNSFQIYAQGEACESFVLGVSRYADPVGFNYRADILEGVLGAGSIHWV